MFLNVFVAAENSTHKNIEGIYAGKIIGKRNRRGKRRHKRESSPRAISISAVIGTEEVVNFVFMKT